MNNEKTGGPAYPYIGTELVSHPTEADQKILAACSYPGMTLRDWFAGQMMAAMATPLYGKEGIHRMTAEACYRFADAMLEAREKP